jgi:hypothetical protein
MNRQKKYKWKVLHRLVKETEIDEKTGSFIIPPVNVGEPAIARMGRYHLPKLPPDTFKEYIASVYAIQKSEIKLLWRKYTAKINKLTKEK